MIDFEKEVLIKLKGCSFAFSKYSNAQIKEKDLVLAKEFQEEQENIREQFTVESIKEDAAIKESRRAFKSLGLDPARYRPSSEALLRRVLKNEELYMINTGVDICNLLSVRYRLPMGFYDLNKINGSLQLKVGTTDNKYVALNGREVICDDKLILCDQVGVVGSPYVDSQRTSMDLSTKNFLHVIYFIPSSFAENNFNDIREITSRFTLAQSENYHVKHI